MVNVGKEATVNIRFRMLLTSYYTGFMIVVTLNDSLALTKNKKQNVYRKTAV